MHETEETQLFPIDASLDVESIRIMRQAYDEAWLALVKSGVPAVGSAALLAQEILGACIVELHKRGPLDQRQIRDVVVYRLSVLKH